MKFNLLTNKEKLGIIIKHIRKKQELNQSDLSKTLIYDQSVISRLEQGYDTISMDLYSKTLNYLDLKLEINIELDFMINDLIDKVYMSYEQYNIPDFEIHLYKVNDYLVMNKNILKHYDLFCLKIICLYMLSRFREAANMILEITDLYEVIHDKLKVLYMICKLHLGMHFKEEILLRGAEHLLSDPRQNALIYYVGARYYLYHYNYSKSIEFALKAIDYFDNTDNIKRKIRTQVLINEIMLIEEQYDYVKNTVQHMLKHQDLLHTFYKNKLFFQMGYAHYHLGEYEESLHFLVYLKKETNYHELDFVSHLINKCHDHLNHEVEVDITNTNAFNYMNVLYFKYQDEVKDKGYYDLIEKYLIPELEVQYYKKEYRYYALQLLDYYYSTKSYTKYKNLSDTIHTIMHIF